MFRFLLISGILSLFSLAKAQVPLKTITEIVTTVANADSSVLHGSKVRVQGVVLSDPNKWYQAPQYPPGNSISFWIQLKGQGGPKSGMQIRLQNATNAAALGVSSLVPGNFAEFKGKVDFYQGEIQLSLDTLAEVQVLEQSVPIAPPAEISINDLNQGSGATPQALPSGKDWQGVFVKIKNGSVVFKNASGVRGNFRVKSAQGNELTIFDSNIDMRLGQNGYTKPDLNETIAEIYGVVYHRGYGQPNTPAGSYELHPFVIPDHIVRDSCNIAPHIEKIDRNPVCPKASEAVTVRATITHPSPGTQFPSVKLYWTTGSGVNYQAMDMTNSGPNEWTAVLQSQAVGTFVHYYVKADAKVPGCTQVVSTTAPTYNPSSYTVNDNGCEIYDIQRTYNFSASTVFPQNDDRFSSGYEFQTVTGVKGVVTSTADKSTNLGYVYIQQRGKSKWAGIQLFTQAPGLIDNLKIGDSVTVSGVVREYFGLTQIEVTDVEVGGAVAPIMPTTLLTSLFVTDLEAQTIATEPYEGMFIMVNEAGLRVVNPMPDATFASRKQHWRVGPDFNLPDNGLRVMTGGISASRCTKVVRYINSEEWAPYLLTDALPCYVNVSTTMDAIRGILSYDFYRAVLLPRNEDDIDNIQGCTPSAIFTPNQKTQSSFTVYPNPTASAFTVQNLAETTFSAELIDGAGKTLGVQKVQKGAAEFNTDNLPQGVYLVKIVTAKGSVYSQKVIVTR